MARGAIWIAWEGQRRNRELASALDMRLHAWPDIERRKNRIARYAIGVARTLAVLVRERPRLVVCQNPSLVLAALLAALKPLFRMRVVVDAHNAGLRPLDGRSPWLMGVARWVQRRADLTIVSNPALQDLVDRNGGRAFVLPDRIPRLDRPGAESPPGRPRLLFICSFADDEPFELVFAAARELGPEYVVFVTGDYSGRGLDPAAAPGNVVLTGFVPEQRFLELLFGADAVIDLTTREDCLVCGAYEALAAGKPMVLSRTAALQRHFDRGAVYTAHTPSEIAAALRQVIRDREALGVQVQDLKRQREQEWEILAARLRDRLRELQGQPSVQ